MASWLGIDLDNDEQILSLSCGLADVERLEDVATLLGKDARVVSNVVFQFLSNTKTEMEIWPEIQEEYEAAFQFLADTNFPEFTHGLSKDEILPLLNKTALLDYEKYLAIIHHPHPALIGLQVF